MSKPGQINNSKIKKEESKLDNSKSNLSNTDNHQIVKNTKPTIAQFLQSKKGKYSLISLLVLSVLLISGLFTYNLLKQDSDTAKAANTTATAFNPSDCATYASNGGTNTAGVCFVKMYEKNGQLYRSLDIAPGELVNVRNYYNNTTTASVTAANITDSMPANFTRVGAVTNSYVDATPVTLNNNVFTGQNLSVAPGAGYFGYAADNTLTSSNLELGKKRYLDFIRCTLLTGSGGNTISPLPFTNTNNNGVATTQAECDSTIGWSSIPSLNSGSYKGIDTLGKRYADFLRCQATYAGSTGNIVQLLSYTNTDNNGVATTQAQCDGSIGWSSVPASNSGSLKGFDSLGKRYFDYHRCLSSGGGIIVSPVGYTNTNNNGVATTQAECDSTIGWNSTPANNSGSLKGFDTLDTTRGYGYISYSMQAPTTGLTNGQQVGTTGTLTASGAKTSGTASSLTITNVSTPNITYTKLYSVDGGSTWSPTVSANPGQSVLVRLWNENTGGLSSTSANIKDSLPNTFTYVAGSAKNCLNPSTTTITSPDNTELVCDSGTSTQKDSLFSTLTNASGVSPSAGLYDAAGTTVASGGTAFNAISGTKDIGKMRYVQQQVCNYVRTTEQAVVFDRILIQANNIPNFTVTPVTTLCPLTNTNPSYQLGTIQGDSAVNTVDTLGDRYSHQQVCNYIRQSDQAVVFDRYLVQANNNPILSITPVTTLCPLTNTNPSYQLGSVPGDSSINTIDTLGDRYVHQQVCNYVRTSDQAVLFDRILIEANNNPNFTVTPVTTLCPFTNTNPSYQLVDSAINTVDTLDATRSKSYIQYEMIIPAGTAGGNYGTQSTIASTATTPEFTSVNSGTNGSGITVAGDPAFSVKKLLALPTSGTGASAVCPTSTSSYSTTLSNTPAGSTVCVRLAYQNKTSGAVSNARIRDEINNSPSGFTRVAGSTLNCLTPATGSEICNTSAGMGGAIDENSVWVTRVADPAPGQGGGSTDNQLDITPHAGFYGISSNSITGVMEMGKKRYADRISCVALSGSAQETYIQKFSNLNSTSPDGDCGGPSNVASITQIDTFAQRYAHRISCTAYSGDAQEVYIQRYVNTTTINNGGDCTPTGVASIIAIDTLGLRYAHRVSCNALAGKPQELYIQLFSNILTTNNGGDCSTAGVASINVFDLLDPANGTGYIQYKMLTPTNPTSTSITLPNVTLAGDNQTTSTSPATINFTNIPEVGCSTTDPCALFETALTYSPTQALAKRYGASGSTNSDNLILTLKDTRLEQSGFTTTCSIKYKFRTDTSYRILTTNSTYNNTTGCTGNLLKANQLLFNVDFEITAITTNTTTNTTKNYLIYSNYDFKAGSIGVTSIGGSGL